jgi:hypothetical protein
MKENLIREYILGIDFRDNWGISKIKEDMKKFLGEEPGIDVTWEKDAMLNEETGEPEIIEKLKKITIVFTDLDDKYKKLEFLIQ